MNVNIMNYIIDIIDNIINQLQNYNSISANNIKLLCYIQYNQNTQYFDENIDKYLTIAFGLINQNTSIYNDLQKPIINNFDEILKSYLTII